MLRKRAIIPEPAYLPLIRLVDEEGMAPDAASKIRGVLEEKLSDRQYFIFERIVRMCARLSAGSLTTSASLADLFAVLLFAAPDIQLDLLLRVRTQKVVLQYCIDHHQFLFIRAPIFDAATPLFLINTPTPLNSTHLAALAHHTSQSSYSPFSSPLSPKSSTKSTKKKQRMTLAMGALGSKFSRKTDSGTSGLGRGGGGIAEGNYANVFALKDHQGKRVVLSSLVESGMRVVLFFYNRENKASSRQILKLFRANIDLFSSCCCGVYGITTAKMSSIADDVASMRLPFPVLADPTGKARARYGIGAGKNATYVLNECGETIHSFDSETAIQEHLLNAFCGLLLQVSGYYLGTEMRAPSHHFEYFYNIKASLVESEKGEEKEKGLGVEEWGVQEVRKWLQGISLAVFVEIFEENLLRGVDLLSVTMEELEEQMELRDHSSLPILVAELNELRVNHAKERDHL